MGRMMGDDSLLAKIRPGGHGKAGTGPGSWRAGYRSGLISGCLTGALLWLLYLMWRFSF
jgi:hypothetical protein